MLERTRARRLQAPSSIARRADLQGSLHRTTKLSKMMAAYCERAGKNQSEVRFMFGASLLICASATASFWSFYGQLGRAVALGELD